MATKEGFTIEISSRYEGWWRYNVALMCGCFDTAGNRTGFASAEAHVADVGSNLREKPAGIPGDGRASLETQPRGLRTTSCSTSISYPIRCRPATTSATRHPSKSKSASHTANGGSARRNASSTSGRAPRSRCAWIPKPGSGHPGTTPAVPEHVAWQGNLSPPRSHKKKEGTHYGFLLPL